ncbi:hypothetical protein [Spiroplasma endosymbiont of Zeiraphera isertana]|uniref:hypothetical protein n=1 Tax=Spiroplasma endosymbiont of Zeiraphera isertana TaxID=3066313 RepID=UPI00313E5BD1
MMIIRWQCDYYENNIRCEEYSKIQPHKDFNNNRVYCENHWKIINKINQERKEFAINQYKQKIIKFLRKEFINFENDLINLPVIKINLLMDKIENGEFD